jgi:hypothetical protein
MSEPDAGLGVGARLSIYLLVLMRVVFLTLLMYLLFSIAAGLMIPGDVVGRYALVAQNPESCSGLQQRLTPTNVNNVRFEVTPADLPELAEGLSGASTCWLVIRGVPDSGVGEAAQPLYDAALAMAEGPLTIEREYQPRFGEFETLAIWLISLLLAVIWVFASRKH